METKIAGTGPYAGERVYRLRQLNTKAGIRVMRMRGRRRTKASGRHWRIAALAAAGAIGATSQAEAQLYYWSDSDPGFSRNWPTVSHQRHKPRRYSGKKIEAPQKESGKPQGPLIIAMRE